MMLIFGSHIALFYSIVIIKNLRIPIVLLGAITSSDIVCFSPSQRTVCRFVGGAG
jgi:hypothetical protein